MGEARLTWSPGWLLEGERSGEKPDAVRVSGNRETGKPEIRKSAVGDRQTNGVKSALASGFACTAEKVFPM
jgi:hypothetical protein